MWPRLAATDGVAVGGLDDRLLSAGSHERQSLRSLLEKLERFELPGDVGRMIYLALENAADEREEAAKARVRTARRIPALRNIVERATSALLPTRHGR
jgi:hypothetical protein